MNNLTIESKNSQLVVDSRLVAKELGVEHNHLIRAIRNHQETLESVLGQLSFENSKPLKNTSGGRPEVFCWLTEDQTIFVMTLSRNTRQVIQCKVNLVKAFSEAKEKLSQSKTPKTFAEALRLAADQQEEIEKQKLVIESLEEDNERQAEAIDELFDYSSTIRIAKYIQQRFREKLLLALPKNNKQVHGGRD